MELIARATTYEAIVPTATPIIAMRNVSQITLICTRSCVAFDWCEKP
jgi:hypothetical protein